MTRMNKWDISHDLGWLRPNGVSMAILYKLIYKTNTLKKFFLNLTKLF